MSADFKPSTRKLLSVVGWENSRLYRSEKDEAYLVYEVVTALSNKIYNEIDQEEYKNGTWPADQNLIDILRAALLDHRHGYVGNKLARILVRFGCRRPETIECLNAWDALMFSWQNEGMTAERAAEILQKAEIIESVLPESIGKINTWVQNPAMATENAYDFIPALFGEQRLVFSSLVDICFSPEHDKLFKQLADKAIPPVQITDVSQMIDNEQRFTDVTENTYLTRHTEEGTLTYRADTDPQLAQEGVRVLSDKGAHWVVQFVHDGKKHAFFAESLGTWMDVKAVIYNFNHFMASLGRVERAFRFGLDGEWGVFIVTDGKRFPEIAERLHIPLHS
jgi:hypothetical protein